MKYRKGLFMFHVYKITNKINGKFYIGVHKTKDFNSSDYMGSGPHIKNAIKKYGKESFIRESLFIFESKELAYNKEREIIDLNNSLSYNLKDGGIGGWDYVNSLELENPMKNPEIVSKHVKTRSKTINENKEYYDGISKKNLSVSHSKRVGAKDSEETKIKRANSVREHWQNHEHPLAGIPLTEEHKKKCSEGWTEESRSKKSESAKEWAKNNPEKLKTNLGKKFDDNHRQRMRNSWEDRPMLRCVHCDLESKSASTMSRWHNDNCRNKTD